MFNKGQNHILKGDNCEMVCICCDRWTGDQKTFLHRDFKTLNLFGSLRLIRRLTIFLQYQSSKSVESKNNFVKNEHLDLVFGTMNGLVLEQSKNYIVGQSSRSNKLKFQLLVEKCLAAC